MTRTNCSGAAAGTWPERGARGEAADKGTPRARCSGFKGQREAGPQWGRAALWRDLRLHESARRGEAKEGAIYGLVGGLLRCQGLQRRHARWKAQALELPVRLSQGPAEVGQWRSGLALLRSRRPGRLGLRCSAAGRRRGEGGGRGDVGLSLGLAAWLPAATVERGGGSRRTAESAERRRAAKAGGVQGRHMLCLWRELPGLSRSGGRQGVSRHRGQEAAGRGQVREQMRRLRAGRGGRHASGGQC